jgi:hypothetical protein
MTLPSIGIAGTRPAIAYAKRPHARVGAILFDVLIATGNGRVPCSVDTEIYRLFGFAFVARRDTLAAQSTKRA